MDSKYVFHPDLQKYADVHIPPIDEKLPRIQRAMKYFYTWQKNENGVSVSSITREYCGIEVPVWLFHPEHGISDRVLLYVHGGGWVFNASQSHFSLVRQMVIRTGCTVVFPDYPLAPDYRFPKALECVCGVYGEILNGDIIPELSNPTVIIAGDSSGGNLAAAACILSHNMGLPPFRAQMLINPALDAHCSTESMKRFTDTPGCSTAEISLLYDMYLNGADRDDSLVSPLLEKNMADLPALYIEIAEYDCLHDEGAAYAEKLRRAGVPTILTEIKGAMHGYDIAYGSGLIDSLYTSRAEFLNSVFSRYGR